MTPLEIFQIPGNFAFYSLLLPFFQVPAWKIEPGLGQVFAFFLSLIFWSWLISIVIAIVNKQFGFGKR